MNTIKLSTLFVGLAMISLFSIGCGPDNTQKKYGISEKNRKILDNDALFTALSAQEQDKVVDAVIEVITEDLNIRTIAEDAAKATKNRNNLTGLGIVSKNALQGIAADSDQVLHQKIKGYLEGSRTEIASVLGLIDRPKNALIALDNLNEFNTIWSQAKKKEDARDELKKLFLGKLGYITKESERSDMDSYIRSFLSDIDEMIIAPY